MATMTKIRRVEFEADTDTGQRSVYDIVETVVPSEQADPKAYLAMRRKLLRDMDKRITLLLAGEIDEISLLATAN